MIDVLLTPRPPPPRAYATQAAQEGVFAAAYLSRKASVAVGLDAWLLGVTAATAAVCFSGLQRDLVCSQVTAANSSRSA